MLRLKNEYKLKMVLSFKEGKMNVREIMKYIESEYIIINNTPCEICGGRYITEGNGFNFEGGVASNVTTCYCENCGNKKEFFFRAPISGVSPEAEANKLN